MRIAAAEQAFHFPDAEASRMMLEQDADSHLHQKDRPAPLDSPEHYCKVVELLPDGIFVQRQGRVVFANCAFVKLLGAGSVQELLGKSVMEFVSPEGREFVQQQLGRVTEAAQPLAFQEATILRRDGVELQVELAAAPIACRGQAGTGTLVLARDISQRKTAEQALREMERRTRAIIEAALDCIITVDAERRILEFNAAAEQTFGYKREEVIGKTFAELLIPSALRARHERAFTAHLATGKSQVLGRRVETMAMRRDGTEFPIELATVQITGGQQPVYSAYLRDITQRKQLEAQFLRAQRMESIGRLATGIAHDLNNILAPILMSVPMLRWGLAAPEFEKTLARIEASAIRGAEVVKQLLTFGRGVEGQRGTVQPRGLLKEMMRIIEETFPKSIQLCLKAPKELWTFAGDVTQLHQVLLNLCVNARDAMPNGGKLSLGAENVELDEYAASRDAGAKPGPYVMLYVSDTGTGIPPELLEKIFEPFFTTKLAGQGTGLGLATALGIVKSHGGFIEVATETGRGTNFKIYLPATPGAPESDSVLKNKPAPRGHGEAILLVDDEPLFREITRQVLSNAGYQVLAANDGIEALAAFATHREKIQLVVTDFAMPLLNGLDLIRVLKKMAPELKIIVSSGLSEESEQDEKAKLGELGQMGAIQFLMKPYKADELLIKVNELLRARPAQAGLAAA